MEQKALYAVAIERRVVSRGKVTIQADFEYLRASDVNEARIIYTAANPDRRRVRIVGIAPVVGYVAADDNADVVLV